MGKGECRGQVGAPAPPEQVESPNKTYLFHLRSVCVLHGRGGERPLGSQRSRKLSQGYSTVGEWSVGKRVRRPPTFQGDSGSASMQAAADDC